MSHTVTKGTARWALDERLQGLALSARGEPFVQLGRACTKLLLA